MKRKLLITDMDNTLYDWVTYFVKSFYSMVTELEKKLGVNQEKLLNEFKKVNQKYGNTEQPFSLFEIETVKKQYPHQSRRDLYFEFEEAIDAFRKAREKHLKLYNGVQETLTELEKEGVIIVAHTEAAFFNAYYRILKLNLKENLRHLYTLDSKVNLGHPINERSKKMSFPKNFVKKVPLDERKPNPKLIVDICKRENIGLEDTYYIGDSTSRDISMANEAGITSIYAKYGKSYTNEDWKKLVKVTHWTEEDVKREEELRRKYSDSIPDYTVSNYGQVLDIVTN